jgi:predicted Zn-ribbon and HTH transcriptional regulator
MEDIEDEVEAETEKPEECESCGYETERLTLYDSHNGDNPLAWLCEVCASTYAGNAYHYPRQYENRHIMQQISYCTNLILDTMGRANTGLHTDGAVRCANCHYILKPSWSHCPNCGTPRPAGKA